MIHNQIQTYTNLYETYLHINLQKINSDDETTMNDLIVHNV